MFDPYVVPSFGAGLHFSDNPRAIRDDEWTWGRGWLAQNGFAEVLPGYVQVTSGVWPGQGAHHYDLVGLAQNPFDWDSQSLIVGFVDAVGPPVRLYKVNYSGTRTEITWDGAGFPPAADPLVRMHSAFLNGYALYNFGTDGGPTTLVRWDGGANYHGITATGTPQPYYLVSFGGHLVAAVYETLGIALTPVGVRRLAISDANNESTWLPDISNSADSTVLDDTMSPINGLAPVGDNLGIFTRGGVYVLTPTGGIPPFTRQLISRRGCKDSMPTGASYTFPVTGAMVGTTPIGTVYRGTDDFYVAETGRGIGQKVYYYYEQQLLGADPPPFYVWHDGRGVLLVPMPTGMLCYDPHVEAWSQIGFPSTPLLRHAVVWDARSAGVGIPSARHYLGVGTQIFAERNDGVPAGGEVVDTKDFTFGSPPVEAYVSRIKLDWEPLTNATTDAVDILAYARNDLSPSLLGSAGMHADLTAQFVLQGTLAGGASELPVNLRGKYIRLRFRQNSGRMRIRGFTIMAEKAGDRRT